MLVEQTINNIVMSLWVLLVCIYSWYLFHAVWGVCIYIGVVARRCGEFCGKVLPNYTQGDIADKYIILYMIVCNENYFIH